MESPITIDGLNSAPTEAFTATLAEVFESSPWVATRAADARPFLSLDALHSAMVAAFRQAPVEDQLRLIRAHPDLAGKAALAGELTNSSAREQAGAGLDSLTPGELAEFQALNEAYRSRFQFPFIIAVKGLDKYAILSAYKPRLTHDREQEIDTAIMEIAKIARFRLDELVTH